MYTYYNDNVMILKVFLLKFEYTHVNKISFKSLFVRLT